MEATPSVPVPSMPGGGAFGRSARREVRNPVLALPAARAILALPGEQRAPLAYLLRDLARQAEDKAQEAWRARKGIMAAYWRAVCTYAKHLARVLAPRRDEAATATTMWMPIPPKRELDQVPWDGRPWLIGRPGYPPVVAQFLWTPGGHWWHFEEGAQCYGHYQDPTHYAPVFPVPGGHA